MKFMVISGYSRVTFINSLPRERYTKFLLTLPDDCLLFRFIGFCFAADKHSSRVVRTSFVQVYCVLVMNGAFDIV